MTLAGYLGDLNTMIVHHLAKMTLDCHIHEIKKVNSKYFVPDTLDRAKQDGFIPCKNCN